MYLWWSLYTLYLHACQVRVTVGDSGLCCCVCVTSFKCYWMPLCVDSDLSVVVRTLTCLWLWERWPVCGCENTDPSVVVRTDRSVVVKTLTLSVIVRTDLSVVVRTDLSMVVRTDLCVVVKTLTHLWLWELTCLWLWELTCLWLWELTCLWLWEHWFHAPVLWWSSVLSCLPTALCSPLQHKHNTHQPQPQHIILLNLPKSKQKHEYSPTQNETISSVKLNKWNYTPTPLIISLMTVCAPLCPPCKSEIWKKLKMSTCPHKMNPSVL